MLNETACPRCACFALVIGKNGKKFCLCARGMGCGCRCWRCWTWFNMINMININWICWSCWSCLGGVSLYKHYIIYKKQTPLHRGPPVNDQHYYIDENAWHTLYQPVRVKLWTHRTSQISSRRGYPYCSIFLSSMIRRALRRRIERVLRKSSAFSVGLRKWVLTHPMRRVGKLRCFWNLPKAWPISK